MNGSICRCDTGWSPLWPSFRLELCKTHGYTILVTRMKAIPYRNWLLTLDLFAHFSFLSVILFTCAGDSSWGLSQQAQSHQTLCEEFVWDKAAQHQSRNIKLRHCSKASRSKDSSHRLSFWDKFLIAIQYDIVIEFIYGSTEWNVVYFGDVVHNVNLYHCKHLWDSLPVYHVQILILLLVVCHHWPLIWTVWFPLFSVETLVVFFVSTGIRRIIQYLSGSQFIIFYQRQKRLEYGG